MPTSPRKPCRYPNCAELVDKGYCPTHDTSANRWSRMRPADSLESRFYGSAAWQSTRRRAMERDLFLCQECRRLGILIPAKDVHHIVPIAQDLELGLDLDNLQSLCRKHHRQIEKQQY